MRRKITKAAVDRLKPGQFIADTVLTGFTVRRLDSGTVTFGFRYRDKRRGGRRHWLPCGLHGDVTAEQARIRALQFAKDVRENKQPLSAREQEKQRVAIAGGTVNEALDNFVERYVRPNLRSAVEVERCLNVYVRPALGAMPLYSVRRRDVVELLDHIEDSNGAVMCDRVLAHLRKCFNWIATRDDAFTPPIVRGMSRARPAAERARKRILADAEIVDLWAALDDLGDAVPACFPALVRFLLLSAQRRSMASNMAWQELDGRVWTIPEHRHKGRGQGAFVLPLTEMLVGLMGERRKSGFVFSSDNGKRAFSGFSKAKRALDLKLAKIRKANGRKPMEPWVFHDLRRTARSLMARAGVPTDHAERTLAHVVGGVRGVYDLHQYDAEKLAALKKLGRLVDRIMHPSESVVLFAAKK